MKRKRGKKRYCMCQKSRKEKEKKKCNFIHYKVQNINMLKSPYRKKETLKD